MNPIACFKQTNTGRWRWKRLLLAGSLTAILVGSAGGYLGYRALFRKNPEVMKQIKQSEQHQQAIDDLFAEPPAAPNPG